MIENLLLLTGEDDFRLRERARFYRTKFVEKYPDGEVVDFSAEKSFLDLENLVLTPNLFGGKRMAVCEGFWSAEIFEKAEKTKFFARLPEFTDSATVLVLAPKMDKRLKASKFLKANAKVELFEPMDESGVLRWVEKQAEKIGGKISRANAQLLLGRCGINLWNLDSELRKLVSASDGEIDREDVLTMTLPHPQLQIWDFTEKLSRRDAAGAIAKFRMLLQMGQTPYEIFPMIQREIRIHAQLRAGIDSGIPKNEIAKTVGLHPFVVNKTLPLTQNFSAAKIATLYDALFAIDRRIKTGEIYSSVNDTTELELEVEKFILTVCQA